ncbi:MAG TPA: hypothetical protein VGH33_03545 [Isosphaeraceae bacterium]
MHNASFQQLSDHDKQVTIVLYEGDQPPCVLPARLKAIAMTGARLLVDGPTVPAAGAPVVLSLGYPTLILYTSGKVAYAHPAALGSHAIWIEFRETCRGEPLRKARDLIRALR